MFVNFTIQLKQGGVKRTGNVLTLFVVLFDVFDKFLCVMLCLVSL